MRLPLLATIAVACAVSCAAEAPSVPATSNEVSTLLSQTPAFAPRIAAALPFARRAGEATAGLGLTTRLGARYDAPWTLSLDGVEVLRLRHEGADAALSMDGNLAVYRGTSAGTDTAIAAGPDALEWFYVARHAEEVRFSISVEGLGALGEPRSFGDGLEWRDAQGPRLRMPAPFAIDARGERTPVQLRYEHGKLVVSLDARKLTAPILIDPALEAVRWSMVSPTPGVDRGVASMGGRLWIQPFNDEVLWELDGTSWIAHKPKIRPPRGAYELAAVGSKIAAWSGAGTEVWEWDGASWARFAPSTGPKARYTPAFGSFKDTAIAFGGYDFSGDKTDTWQWSAGAWKDVSSTSSPAKLGGIHQMVEVGGAAYVFAGSDLWSWDGTKWTKRGSGIPVSYEATLTVIDGKPVLLGGGSFDAYVFDGTGFVKTAGITTEMIKGARGGMAGGKTYVVAKDRTWLFDGTKLTPVFDTAIPSGVKAMTAVGTKLVAIAGTAADQTWEWDGTKWDKKAPATPFPGRFHASMATLGTKAVVFGGTDTTTYTAQNDTWEWDGTNWTLRAPTTKPAARDFHTLASFGTKIVMYGGGAVGGGEHWEWDGTNWTQKALVPNPGSRYQPAMSTVAGKLLLTGGVFTPTGSGAGPFDLWEYDGTKWTPRTSAHAPPSSLGSMLGGIGSRAILSGGYLVDESWLWDGTDWARLPSFGAPDPRTSAPVAVLGGDLYMSGGDAMSGYSASDELWRLRLGKGQGVACTTDAECATGACADGVCCTTSCKGPCEACNEPTFVGECVPVIGAPRASHPACPSAGAGGPCAARCDGSSRTACVFAASGTTCGKVSCAKGISTKVGACDGAGACSDSPSACAPYGCRDEASCATTCTTDADCAPTARCAAGACVAKKPDGAPSTDTTECLSGNVADGVCCNKPCAGACEACDLAATTGSCTPVLGKARHGTCPAPSGGSACAATVCDGVIGASCAGFVGAETACRPRSCADGVESLPATCTGTGSCPAVATKTCAPFRCDTAACKTKCAADADCIDGFKCDPTSGLCLDGATCDGDHTIHGAKGGDVDCSPYKCAGANCRTTCASSSDCIPSHACDPGSGACVPVTEAAPAAGGCTMSPGPQSFSGGLFALGALGALLARRRRIVSTAAALAAVSCSASPEHREPSTNVDLAPLQADPEMAARLSSALPFDGLVARTAHGRVVAPPSADRPVEVRGGHSLQVGLVAATGVSPTATSSGALVYRNAYPSTDAVVVAAGDGSVEFAWIARDDRAPRSFSLSLPSALTARLEGAAVLLADDQGATVAALRPAHARDGRGRRFALVPRVSGSTYTLDVPGDAAYPVAVDPVLETFRWTKLSGYVPLRTAVSAAELGGKVIAVGSGGDTWAWTPTSGWSDTGARSVLPGTGCNDMAALGGKLVRLGSSYATWFFDGTTWSAITISPAPSPRTCAAMAVNGTKLVLHGGTRVPDLIPLDDTWEFDGTTWTEMKPVAKPPTEYKPQLMAYAGGPIFRGNSYGETWQWTGSNWSQLAGYQAVSGTFGVSRSGTPSLLEPAGVWEWRGTSWVLRAIAGGPGTFKGATGVGGQIVVFNDGDPVAGTHDTWAFDGSVYSKTTERAIPPSSDVAAWGTTHVTAIGPLGTWEWSGAAWSRRSATDPTTGYYYGRLYGLDDRASYVDFDARVWQDWNGTSWTKPTLTKWPTQHYDFASTSLGSRVLVSGGGSFVSGSYVSTAETWECTSTTCADKTPSTTVVPSAFRALMARHGSQATIARAGYYFAGSPGPLFTWTGTDWVAKTPLLEPPYLYNGQFVTLGSRALLYGGSTPDPVNDVAWTWDGATWAKVVPSTPVPNGKLVLLGGAPFVVDQGALWKGELLGAKGNACTLGTDCISGTCVDGRCCDGACTGQCEACNLPGKEGTCSAVVGAPVGARTVCTATPTACGLSCDGTTRTACTVPKSGTPCGAPKCKDGIAALAGTCDGAGACSTGTKTCAPFRCAGDACGTACTVDYDCDVSAYCDAASCVAKKKAGEPATEGRACATGFAADGVCCSTACTGVCEACDADATKGTCTPKVGAAKHGACPKPASTDPCVATSCDGKVGNVCAAYPGPEVSCGTAGCEGGVERRAVTCNNSGACPAAETKKCGAYACGALTCLTACTADKECAPGNRCKDGKCVASSTCADDHFVVSPSGSRTNCAPFRCADGACVQKCADSSACLAGYACDTATGKCAPAAAPVAEDGGGCSMAAPSSSSAPAAFAFALLLLRRRRR